MSKPIAYHVTPASAIVRYDVDGACYETTVRLAVSDLTIEDGPNPDGSDLPNIRVVLNNFSSTKRVE